MKAIECKKCSTIRTDRETQTETAAVSSINVADILRKIGNIVPAVEEKPKITKQEVLNNEEYRYSSLSNYINTLFLECRQQKSTIITGWLEKSVENKADR